MASIAWVLFSLRSSIHCWTASLLADGESWGARFGSYPNRMSLNNKPVVTFLWLLCTAVAIAIQYVQSSGDTDITKWRYCSTHWFFHSNKLSVCGWKAVEKFCWMSSFWLSAYPKCEVKQGFSHWWIWLGVQTTNRHGPSTTGQYQGPWLLSHMAERWLPSSTHGQQ